jgi:hypothetical protein
VSATTPAAQRALPSTAHVRSATLVLFATTIFAGASLVFLIQPMLAKMVLPLFGGTPAVWAVSLVFFQAVLLGGYAFAHVSSRLSVRRQALVQLALLATPIAFLPIAVPDESAAAGEFPALRLLAILAVAAGVPFFVGTTASPVLQRWFSAAGDRASADPYFLYAASNAGSFLGLLAYPVLIEPALDLSEQAKLWTGLYAVFAVLVGLCALRVSGVATARKRVVAPPLAWSRRTRWLAMGAVPSALMVGVSTYLTNEIASAPLLWVVPLAVYLLSFVGAFARRPWFSLRTNSRLAVLFTVLTVASMLHVVPVPSAALVALFGATLFVLALLVHRRLADERPPAERLTDFYLVLSAGGVCGGALAALLAPVVFPLVLELPLALSLALLLRPGARGFARAQRPLKRFADVLVPIGLFAALIAGLAVASSFGTFAVRFVLGAAALALVLLAARPVRFALGAAALFSVAALGQLGGLHTERTFFSVLRVAERSPGEHVLVHGTRVHGTQWFRGEWKGEPVSYYTRTGPVGQFFAGPGHDARDVGVIGLGAGTAAAYGSEGGRMTFYEIDGAVAEIASEPRFFTFLRDSPAQTRIVVGDGRLELARERDGAFDVLMLDAFSSGSVPVHLLTREAFELYMEKLRPDGLVIFNVTNTHLDLEPVVGRVARSLGLAALAQTHHPSAAARDAGAEKSTWVAIGRSREALGALASDARWHPARATGAVWTDSYSNVLGALRWGD